MDKENKSNKTTGEAHVVPVVPYIPDDLVLQFSDGVNVKHTGNEFIISFLQLEHPIASTEEEMGKIESVRNKCVARVVVTPKGMASLIDVLQRNFEKYENKKLKSGGE